MLTVFGIAAACGSPKPARLGPVYRYINVLDGSTVRLGERFDREDVTTRIDDTTFAFRPGTFSGGGTAAITAYTDRFGLLKLLCFVYDGSESFETKVRDYRASLGAPVDSSATASGAVVVTWEDSLTRFDLYYAPGQRGLFWSRLVDRAGSDSALSNKQIELSAPCLRAAGAPPVLTA